jgi:hypothetical protein
MDLDQGFLRVSELSTNRSQLILIVECSSSYLGFDVAVIVSGPGLVRSIGGEGGPGPRVGSSASDCPC